MMSAAVDAAELAARIELVDVTGEGAVRVRFTGMCAGCQLRPLTLRGTVRPALLDVTGVTAVDAAGARISDEAAARMARYLGEHVPRLPSAAGASGGAG